MSGHIAASVCRLTLAGAILLTATAAAAQSGVITGTVRDAITGAPISTGIALCVEDGAWCRQGWMSDAAGHYRAEVNTGVYYVYTFGSGGGRAYIDEIFPDILCPGDCDFRTALQSGGRLVVTANGTIRADFALYAGGRYGVIDEMYVVPAWRARGVGRRLIDAVKARGRERGWRRIDVTAPPEKEWERTVRFYQQHGFVFTGPKLRAMLP